MLPTGANMLILGGVQEEDREEVRELNKVICSLPVETAYQLGGQICFWSIFYDYQMDDYMLVECRLPNDIVQFL